MFELLLLIGFLYAGFFPPSPAPSPSQTAAPSWNDGHAPDTRISGKSRAVMKGLAHKNKNC